MYYYVSYAHLQCIFLCIYTFNHRYTNLYIYIELYIKTCVIRKEINLYNNTTKLYTDASRYVIAAMLEYIGNNMEAIYTS